MKYEQEYSCMDKITIYGKDACVYCDMAISLAEKKGMYISVKKLDKNFTVEEFTSLFPFAKTVPQIVLNGEHIGGYQDLKDLV